MKKILLGLFFVLFASIASAADITASVNRSPMPLGEISMLTISADGDVSAQPDLSVLRPMFKVYSTSVSKQSYIVNGQSSSTTTWQIGFMPLTPGKQQIPSIKIGADKSAPIDIEVLSAGVALPPETTNANVSAEPKSSFAMEGQIVNANKPYYVQQELNYNIILTDTGGLQGGEPVFENNNNDWLIISLGAPDVTTQIVNNKPQRVIIFKYALFAQKSGVLEIPTATFDGYTLGDPMQDMSFGIDNIFQIGFRGLLNIERPVSLRAPGQSVNILPAVSGAGNWWLPAQNVDLKAKTLTDSQNIKQGEPFKRQITLQAVGISETQLPEISFQSNADFKQYPEKAEGSNTLHNGYVMGQKTMQVTYVPQKSGEMELPEISVEWFNVETEKMEKATIPAEVINVKKNETFSQPAPQISTPATQIQNQAPVTEVVQQDERLGRYMWPLGLIAAFLAGLFLSAFLFRRHPDKPQCETRRFPKYIVEKAYQNDYRSLRDALISWATGFYPEASITNLNDVAKASNLPAFKEQIDILIQNLYNAENAPQFNAKVFVDAFRQAQNLKKRESTNKTPLPPLYD